MMMRTALAPMGDSHSQTFTTTCAFERRQLSAFPIALGAVNKNPAKHLFVHVFCVCQLPESYDSNMIQCDKCSLTLGIVQPVTNFYLIKFCSIIMYIIC